MTAITVETGSSVTPDEVSYDAVYITLGPTTELVLSLDDARAMHVALDAALKDYKGYFERMGK